MDDTQVTAPKPRPLDEIHAELVRIRNDHAEAIAKVRESGETIQKLTAELREAVAYFETQVKALEADTAEAMEKTTNWLKEQWGRLWGRP